MWHARRTRHLECWLHKGGRDVLWLRVRKQSKPLARGCANRARAAATCATTPHTDRWSLALHLTGPNVCQVPSDRSVSTLTASLPIRPAGPCSFFRTGAPTEPLRVSARALLCRETHRCVDTAPRAANRRATRRRLRNDRVEQRARPQRGAAVRLRADAAGIVLCRAWLAQPRGARCAHMYSCPARPGQKDTPVSRFDDQSTGAT